MSLVCSAIRADTEYGELLSALRQNFRNTPLPLLANGLCEGASDAFLCSLITDTCTPSSPDGGKTRAGRKRCALIVVSDEKEGLRLSLSLSRFGLRAECFPGRDLSFYSMVSSHEYEQSRIRVLSGLLHGSYDAVITTPDAAMGYTVPPEHLGRFSFRLDFHTPIDMPSLREKLVAAGYCRVDLIDAPGQFALRGDILDIYPPCCRLVDDEGNTREGSFPLRIELFGDDLDRMGIIDMENQRTVTAVDEADILPSRELLPDRDGLTRIRAAIDGMLKRAKEDKVREVLTREAAEIDSILGTPGRDTTACDFFDKYLGLIYRQQASLGDYFEPNSPLFVLSNTAVHERLRGCEKILTETVLSMLERGMLPPKYAEYSRSSGEFETLCDSMATVHVDQLSYGFSTKRLGGIFGFRARHLISYADKYSLLKEDVEGFIKGGYRVIINTENRTAALSLYNDLRRDGVPAVVSEDEIKTVGDVKPGYPAIVRGQMIFGFELLNPRIAVISAVPDAQIGSIQSPSATVRAAKGNADKAKKKRQDVRAILSFNDLTVGDIVVHEAHGLGRFCGIERLRVSGAFRDYIAIQYAGDGKLFVPVDCLDAISKYIGTGAEDGNVKLSRLGSGAWEKAKARAKLSVKNIAKDLIRLYAERLRRPGYAFAPDDEFSGEFASAFEYQETDSQLAAINEIRADMEKPVPMDRLLCGDVGYGKTEVAMRAAFKAVMDGKQVAVLVPTTILAMQHYQTFTSRMRAFSVRVDMVSRFRSPKQTEVSLNRLERGDTDIIIGTHKLLGKSVRFHDLGLLIVDEEQRFGVAQKEKLKMAGENIDVLTLTATPIPRTLNMAMTGIRDMSILDEAPIDRLPVQTYVLEEDDEVLMEALRKEFSRGGQAFWLHNDIESLTKVAARVHEHLPDCRLEIAHGQMDKSALELIWQRMLTGEIDLLICTTIIETGVDVPNANTLIVDCADRMGLSQLHQLRGRVGRSSRRAYAYFTFRRESALSEIAQKRLAAIQEYAEFGAGFRIAMRDMELRGIGNLLGAEQHGQAAAVGYDMYVKLLSEAILEETDQKPEEPPFACSVNIPVDAFLPESYVHYPAQRMALYKRIAKIRNKADMEDMIDELCDRYGNMPVQAVNLLNIALIKADAMACRVGSVRGDEKSNDIYLTQAGFDTAVWMKLIAQGRGRLRIIAQADGPVVKVVFRQGEDRFGILHRILRRYLKIKNPPDDGAEKSPSNESDPT